MKVAVLGYAIDVDIPILVFPFQVQDCSLISNSFPTLDYSLSNSTTVSQDNVHPKSSHQLM